MSSMRLDFQRLFEAAPALFMVLAPDPPQFTVLAASDAYVRAVKKHRNELIGLPVFEALPPSPEDTTSKINSSASFQRAIDLRVPDPMGVQRHDITRPESEGGGFETKYWSAVNTPVLDQNGTVLYILHRVEDVTEFMLLKQRDAEHQAHSSALQDRVGQMQIEIYRRSQELQEAVRNLREANRKLGELDRDKMAFFSNVSHEFRTPLTLMLGLLEELLERNDLPNGVIADLTVAHRNSLRLQRLVNALLDFSRLEAGRFQANYEPTDVGTLTAELASSFHSACEKAGLRYIIHSPPTKNLVYVDRDLWEKIVLNLVSNAFKFTLEGQIEVRVNETSDGCELSVKDTGVGIPADEISRIFERFHRVHSTRGRSLEGTGIGLSLVYELVKLHGGEVRVESSLGQGSTFTVKVPYGTAHLPADRIGKVRTISSTSVRANAFVEEASRWVPEEQPALLAKGESHIPQTDAAALPRVLLADDNADMRDYIRRLLAPKYHVLTARDGQEALDMARRERPDLVLTDVMMPRLDGFGLLRALRADPDLQSIPIILISARAGEAAKGEGWESGADDYIIKPFSARELMSRLAANLKMAKMREEVASVAAREEALKDLDQRKNEFLAMLSHELRNPLAPIRNSLYILSRTTPGGEQAKRAQQVIERQVAHLSRMLEDLLDLSRITQGKMQIQKERLNLNDLTRGVIEDARELFERKGIALRVDIQREPLLVRGDSTRLTQIIGNLLTNAVKFTPAGGRVELFLHAANNETAEISVCDNGVGVEPEVLRHLFKPFVQADRTIDRSAGGLGLGLAIVKGLVDAHGGKVTATSDGPGKGTKFVVDLPLCERVRQRSAIPSPSGSQVQTRRVLIIEDNVDAAETLKEALELSGHEIEIAYDGQAGLERAVAWQPDAIVSDIGMPRLDGYGVAKFIRADPDLRGVCLVAITGYAALDDVDKSREAGFDHHMPKPPDVRALEKILASCSSVMPRGSTRS